MYVIPSVFADRVTLGLQEHPGGAPVLLVYPIPGDRTKLLSSHNSDSLAALIGGTRAAMLSILWEKPLTTSQLGKQSLSRQRQQASMRLFSEVQVS